MEKLKTYSKIVIYIIVSICLLFMAFYFLGVKIMSNQMIQRVLKIVNAIDYRIFLGVLLFVLTIMISQVAKHVINSIQSYKKSQAQDKKDEAVIARQFFLSEKQKIKDAMFKDYMKHQRK